jgi:hypothetical protein
VRFGKEDTTMRNGILYALSAMLLVAGVTVATGTCTQPDIKALPAETLTIHGRKVSTFTTDRVDVRATELLRGREAGAYRVGGANYEWNGCEARELKPLRCEIEGNQEIPA